VITSSAWRASTTPTTSAVSEKRGALPLPNVITMLTTLKLSSIFVLDHQVALDFYVGKLGLEIRTDADLGFMRWVTVGVPGEEREVLLEIPAPPAMDPATAERVRELVTKGSGGGWLGFNTDDAYATYEDLRTKGVDLTEEPTERPYGIDIGVRDPFGNAIRISQLPTGGPA
jgi:catechol 2,3-dioxygenase-like lactoylglutathione lyase family enzyme